MVEFFHPDIIFSEDYYTDIHNKILLLSEINKTKYEITYNDISNMCVAFLNKQPFKGLYGVDDIDIDVYLFELYDYYDLLKLLLHIIINKIKIEGKTYSDFNIDLHYFLNILENYTICEYKFDKHNKLFEFILESQTGIKYKYDDKYKIKEIKFIDENFTPII